MAKKALVVIDIQNDITKHYRDIIDNVNAAIDWAEAQGMLVVYIKHNNIYVSLPKSHDPLTVSLEEATELIEGKRKAEAERIIKTYEQEPALQVLNGRFGPYIAYNGKNYKLPKSATPTELTLEECLEIVKQQSEREPATAKGGRKQTKKKQG